MPTLRSLLLAFVLLPATVGAHSLGEPRMRGGISSTPVSYGDFVYAANGITVDVWDISDAAHPVQVPFTPEEPPRGPIFGLAVVGGHLYVGWSNDARTSGAFQIYSLADPAYPARAGEAETTHSDALLPNGDYLYEVDAAFGVTALDVRDPLHPLVAGSATGTFLMPSSVLGAQLVNGYLYVSGSSLIESAWDTVFDLADPAHPVSVDAINLGAFGMVAAVSDSGYAFAFGSEGGIYDVRNPAHAELVGTLPAITPAIDGITSAAFLGDDLFLFGGEALPVFDLSMPAEPRQVAMADIDTRGFYSLTPLPHGFLVNTITGSGLLIDASVPTAPVLSSEIRVPAPWLADVALDDRNIFVVGAGHALEVIDAASLDDVGVLDPAPDDEDGWRLGSSWVGVSGATAILGGYMMLFAVDVADSAHPEVIGSLPIDYYDAMLVDGNRAYVPTFDDAMAVVDIADPGAMVVRGTVDGRFKPLAAAGDLVFAYGDSADYFTTGVWIVDASDASHPVVVGRYDACSTFLTSFVGLAVSEAGTTMAVACSDASVEFVDVRNPAAPVLTATYEPAEPDDATLSVAARGSTFYLGNVHGIDEIDAANPAAPVLFARHPTASSVTKMKLAPNGSVLALTATAGMYVFDCIASDGERVMPCRDEATVPSRPSPAHSRHELRRE